MSDEACPKCGGELLYTGLLYERRCANGSLFTARQGGGWTLCELSIGCKQATEFRDLTAKLAAVEAENKKLRRDYGITKTVQLCHVHDQWFDPKAGCLLCKLAAAEAERDGLRAVVRDAIDHHTEQATAWGGQLEHDPYGEGDADQRDYHRERAEVFAAALPAGREGA